ncbi:MAG TPA: cytochrome P450 [Pseudonocardia sp.]|jgi:cytochrome P450
MAAPTSPLADARVAGQPFDYYRELRTQSPVHRDRQFGFYLVVGYREVRRVLQEHEVFSSMVIGLLGGSLAQQPYRPAVAEIVASGWPHLEVLNFADRPSHTRHRALVGQGFRPGRVTELRPAITRIATELAGSLPSGAVDLVEGYTSLLPVAVLGEALGVQKQDRHRFLTGSKAVFRRLGEALTEEEDIAAAREVLALQRFMAELVEQRRDGDHDDVLADLVHARFEDMEPFTLSELLSIITTLLTAGHETTANGLGSTILQLLHRPDDLAAIRADRSRLPAFIEETLRLRSPVQMLWRVATRDVELGGTVIPAGSLVQAVYGAANLDEAQFASADDLCPHRSNIKTHVAFGYGIHHCLGAALAREEITIAVNALLDEFRSIELIAERPPRHLANFVVHGLGELPVRVGR